MLFKIYLSNSFCTVLSLYRWGLSLYYNSRLEPRSWAYYLCMISLDGSGAVRNSKIRSRVWRNFGVYTASVTVLHSSEFETYIVLCH